MLNYEKFMTKEPTFIGSIQGWRFYEHPVYGDEVELVVTHNGQAAYSGFYDMPNHDEWLDDLDEYTQELGFSAIKK